MRILHLISSNGLLGAERVVIELSKGLKLIQSSKPIIGIIRNEYNPHIEVLDEAKDNHIESMIFPCRKQFDLKLIFLIGEFMKNSKIDIVHCHGYKSNFYGLLAAKKKIPTITTNHNWLRSHWKLNIYCFLDSFWIRCFDKIVAVSEEIKEEMLRYRIPEEKITVIDNGINIDRFDKTILIENIRKKLGINRDEKIVGTIGSLNIEKGHVYLLKAAKAIIEIYKNVKLLIIGDGPLKTLLKEEMSSLGIADNVIFTGYRNDIYEMLSVMDVFVLSSVKEGLPMVLLEAMAAKKPVIATRIGAVPKVIKNEENGILVKPKDVNGLQQAIIDLLNDTPKAQYLAVKGYTTVRKEFSSERMCDRYFKLYKELIN